MNCIKKLKTKEGILDWIELTSALVFLTVGKILFTFAGDSIAILVLTVLMLAFVILLIVFFRQHIYGNEKPLLTVLSIYYKSLTYLMIIICYGNLPGKYHMAVVLFISLVIYSVLHYVYGKRNNQNLNPYCYFLLGSLAF